MAKRRLKDLAVRLRTVAEEVPNYSATVQRQVAFAIIKDLIIVTPVDTTNALSNWQISLGAPAAAEREPFVPGFLGYTASASQAAAIADAEARLKAHKPGQPIFISNLAPYIVALNGGSSKQEPAGFVERSVLIGRKMLSNVKIKL